MKLTTALTLFCLPALFGADWKPAEIPLTTPWTSLVSPDHALPEYPRPQMARKDWINLNGLWALSGVKRPLTPEQRFWNLRPFMPPNLFTFDITDAVHSRRPAG